MTVQMTDLLPVAPPRAAGPQGSGRADSRDGGRPSFGDLLDSMVGENDARAEVADPQEPTPEEDATTEAGDGTAVPLLEAGLLAFPALAVATTGPQAGLLVPGELATGPVISPATGPVISPETGHATVVAPAAGGVPSPVVASGETPGALPSVGLPVDGAAETPAAPLAAPQAEAAVGPSGTPAGAALGVASPTPAAAPTGTTSVAAGEVPAGPTDQPGTVAAPAAAAQDSGTGEQSAGSGEQRPTARTAEVAPTASSVLASAPASGTGAVNGVGSASATASPSGPAPVSQQLFDAVQQATRSGEGTHRMTVRLDPGSLGEVRVHLVARDGALQVHLSAGREALAALGDGSSELHRLLQSTGAVDVKVTVRDFAGGSDQQRPGQDTWVSQDPGSNGSGGSAGDRSGREHDAVPDLLARTQGSTAPRGQGHGGPASHNPAGSTPTRVDLAL